MTTADYAHVVACISKPPSSRTRDEIDQLYPWLLIRAEKQFEKMDPQDVKYIIRNCEFIERQRDDIVIKQGDVGDCFFIILTGKVAIYVRTEGGPPEEVYIDDIDPNDPKPIKGKASAKKKLDRSRFGNYIVAFEAGKAFGELALINKDCIRNASIICEETCHFMVIYRDVYNRSLRSQHQQEFESKKKFINSSPLFNGWQQRYKRQAAMSLVKSHVRYNEAVVRQGDPLNGLYFILEGQAKIVTDTLQHVTQYPNLHLNEDQDELRRKELIGELAEQENSDSYGHSRVKLWDKPLRRRGYVFGEQRNAQKNVEISVLMAGQVIGDIEYGLGLDTYCQSCVCAVPLSLFALNKTNFDRLVMKRNPKTLQALRDMAEVEIQTRIERFVDKPLPLLEALNNKLHDAHRKREQSKPGDKIVPANLRAEEGDFFPPRGPVIDLYGPGTVFYRNKMKRTEKVRAARARAKAEQNMKLGQLRIVDPLAFVAGDAAPDEEELTNTLPPINALSPFFLLDSDEEEEEVFNDWETGSEHLRGLEHKMEQWYRHMESEACKRVHASSSAPSREKVLALKRFMKDSEIQLHPGRKVRLRRRHRRHQMLGDGELAEDENPEERKVFITEQPAIRSQIDMTVLRSKDDKNAVDNQEHVPVTNADGSGGVHSGRLQGAEEDATTEGVRAICVSHKSPPMSRAMQLFFLSNDNHSRFIDYTNYSRRLVTDVLDEEMAVEDGDEEQNQVEEVRDKVTVDLPHIDAAPPGTHAYARRPTYDQSIKESYNGDTSKARQAAPMRPVFVDQHKSSTFPLMRAHSVLLPSRVRKSRCKLCNIHHNVLSCRNEV